MIGDSFYSDLSAVATLIVEFPRGGRVKAEVIVECLQGLDVELGECFVFELELEQ